MNDSLMFDAGAVTAIIGYTERLKNLLPDKWAAGSVLISCTLGVLYALSLRPGKHEIVRNVCQGIMIGLAASGGFAGMKGFRETIATEKR